MADARLVTSALTPEVAPLLFDHERQLAIFIDALRSERRSRQPSARSRPIAVASPYDILAERFVLHATKLLPSLVEKSVYLFWYRLYPEASAIDVLRHLRNFLVEAWLTEDENTDVNELAVLSFDDADTLTIQNVMNIIRSILTRLGLGTVVAVVEIVGSADSSTLHDIAAAVHEVQQGTLSNLVAVFLGSPRQIEQTFGVDDALLLSLDQLPDQWRSAFTRASVAMAERGRDGSARRASPDLLELVVPLTALQSGASKEIVSYIENHMRASNEEVDVFVREHFVVPLLKGGLSLSERGLRVATANRDRIRDYDEVVSNGSRVIAFVPPENLAAVSTLDALRRYVDTNFRLVDSTGAMLSLARRNIAPAKRLAADLASQITGNEVEFQRSNEYHHATLIKYLSQVLMRPRYNLDSTFFTYLEKLSRGFAEYLVRTVNPRSEGLYRASRLMTNIGYVYDRMPQERRASVQIRRELLAKAADLLTEHRPSLPSEIARFAYAEGWQRWNFGDVEGGAEVFLQGAKRLAAVHSGLLDVRTDANVVLLASLIFVIDSGGIRDPLIRTAIEKHLRDTGIVDSIDDLCRLLFERPYTLSLSDRYFGLPPTVAMYFCPFDFVAALGTARYLMQHLRTVSRLHVVTEDSPFRLDDRDLVHIIIGGPDTPGPIGDITCRVNPMSAFLFQVKSTEDFADIDVVTYEQRDVITTSGSGLMHDDKWTEFWNKRPSTKENAMDGVALGEILSTILTAGGKHLAEKFVDVVVDRVKSLVRGGSRGDIAASEEAEIEEVRAELDHIAQEGKTVGTSDLIAALQLETKSAVVASSVGRVLSPGGVADAFQRVFEVAEDIGRDPKRMRDVVTGLLRIANGIRAFSSLTMDEKLRLDAFEQALLKLRFEAEDAQVAYETSGILSRDRMAELLQRFQNSTRGFVEFLRKLETTG